MIRIPVKNTCGERVEFTKPDCGCSCRSAAFTRPSLDAGESAELVIAVTRAKGDGPETYRCRWSDQTGRGWSSDCTVEVLARERFEKERCQHLTARPGAVLGDRLTFVQYGSSAADLPPAPQFLGDARIRVVATSAAVEPVDGGFVCRRTSLGIETDTRHETGHGVAQFASDRSVPGVAIEWRVRPAVEVSPSNLVVTDADFAETDIVRRRFLVRRVDGPIRLLSTEVKGLPDGLAKIEQDQSQQPCVTVELHRPPTTVNGSVVFTTDCPDQPRVTIAVSFLAVAGKRD